MPYRKKRSYPTKKRKTSYSIAKKALSKVNKLAGQVEIKHRDLEVPATNLDWNGFLINLNAGITQGTADAGERIGDKIRMKGLRLHFSLDLNTNSDAIYRCILMYDKESSIDFATDFLEVTGDPNVVNSPYDVDQRHKFVILHDKKYPASNGAHRRLWINFSKKLNKDVFYTGGSTTITKGILRLWIFADTSDLLVAKPQYAGVSRVWYSDM